MIRNVLSHLGGVGLYGVVSVCLFFGVFSVAVLVALLARRQFLTRMSTLPLADDTHCGPCPTKGDLSHE